MCIVLEWSGDHQYQLTVILMSRTMLPGEPLSPAQTNAAAKVATIANAYPSKTAGCDETFFDPQDWSELNPEQLEFLSDYSLEREDCSRDMPSKMPCGSLSATRISVLRFAAVFMPAGSEAPEPHPLARLAQHRRPQSCYLQGDFCLHRAIDDVDVDLFLGWP